MEVTAREISHLVSGTVIGDPDVTVNRPSKIEEATEGSITFLANPKYESFAYTTKASIMLVSRDFNPSQDVHPTLIQVDHVYQALQVLMVSFDQQNGHPTDQSSLAQVHSSASVHRSATVGAFTTIGANSEIGEESVIYEHVYVGENVKIGNGVRILPGARIMRDCIIGDSCVIHPNAIIGSDGFGFSKSEDGRYQKIPQLGNVVLEDEVEIGANTVIDRATMGSTVIRKGVKLDNLIQIAHNVEIGENTAMAAQSGVAGSTKIGKNVLVGGQAGIVGHLRIGDGTMIQAQSGVTGNTNDDSNTRLYGSPAIDYHHYLKSFAGFKQLPDLVRKMRSMEREIEQLRKDVRSEQ